MGITTRNILLTLVVVVQLAGVAKGQIQRLGACPSVTASTTAVANTLSKTWFLYARYRSVPDAQLRCTSYIFSNPGTNNQLTLSITGRTTPLLGLGPGIPVTLNGRFTVRNQFNTYGVVIFESLFFPTDFVIIDFGATWLAARSCKPLVGYNIQQVYILTTTRNPTAATINAARNALTAQGIDTAPLITIDQTNC